jgi:hypothetical protein
VAWYNRGQEGNYLIADTYTGATRHSQVMYCNRCVFEHLEGAPDLERTKASRWNDACVES